MDYIGCNCFSCTAHSTDRSIRRINLEDIDQIDSVIRSNCIARIKFCNYSYEQYKKIISIYDCLKNDFTLKYETQNFVFVKKSDLEIFVKNIKLINEIGFYEENRNVITRKYFDKEWCYEEITKDEFIRNIRNGSLILFNYFLISNLNEAIREFKALSPFFELKKTWSSCHFVVRISNFTKPAIH